VSYARSLGVKVEELLISQPDNGEQALEIADTLVRSGAIDVVIVDSVAALVPEGRARGRHGRGLGRRAGAADEQAMRKLTASIHRSNSLVVFINQLRMKIGVMFGSPETTSGGTRSSSTRRSASTSAASARSRRARK
jgi:recombination protein RecA